MPMTSDQVALARGFLSDLGTSEVQQLTISNATGGTFILTYGIDVTGTIAWNATAGTVQNALAALPSIGTGNVRVALNGPFNINFVGTLANTATSIIAANGASLTGAGASAVVVETMQGGITAFSTSELNANYDLANGNFFLGVYYSVLMLLQDAAKFVEYTVGQTTEKKDEIWEHLYKDADLYYKRAIAASQMQIAGSVSVPPRFQPRPYVVGGYLGGNSQWNGFPNKWNRGDGW